MLHFPEGGVSLGGKEDGRGGWSDTIGSAPPENPARRVCLISVHPRPDGSDYGDLSPPSFDTHYPDRPIDRECGPG
jgi:hypothetical protein